MTRNMPGSLLLFRQTCASLPVPLADPIWRKRNEFSFLSSYDLKLLSRRIIYEIGFFCLSLVWESATLVKFGSLGEVVVEWTVPTQMILTTKNEILAKGGVLGNLNLLFGCFSAKKSVTMRSGIGLALCYP
jgi:hypothetical protein